MLTLPNVTLVTVETLCHELAKRTIEDCLSKVQFAEVIVYTDREDKLDIAGARTIKVPNWPSKDDYMQFFQFKSCDTVTTSHVLFLEWDAGICDVSMWRDEFLQYDYLGAPWWYTDGSPNVGNGGFSLRTTRLQRFMKDNQKKYPVGNDNQMCRDCGAEIIREGRFNWAPVDVANDFAFEGFDRLGLPNNLKHFGYHSVINWPLVLSRGELKERYGLMKRNSYVTGYGRTAELARACPWLEQQP